MRRSLFLAAIALCFIAEVPYASAQPYPSRPITIVVPYPAGGTSEILARVLAKKMSQNMGATIVIENVGGASGMIGTAQVSRAAPDGYTLLFGYAALFNMQPVITANMPYDAEKSLEPIGGVGQFSVMMTARKGAPFNTFSEFAEYAKANPGKLNYGSPGAGSTSYMFTEYYKLKHQLDIVHVPYRGGAPAITDLIGDRLDLYTDAIGSLLPRVEDKAAKPIVIFSNKRLASLPYVPTIDELGMPEFDIAIWTGLFAPTGTPKDIIQKVYAELTRALNDKELQGIFEQNYYEVVRNSPADLKKRIASELATWSKIAKEIGVKPQ